MKKNVKDDLLEKDIKKYQKSKIPSWLIILLLKYWAAAAAVFFSVIGGLDIGLDFSGFDESNPAAILASYIKTIVLIGLFLTVFFNYIVRPIVRLMYNSRNNTYKFNMINKKGIITLPLSLVYYMFISLILFFVTIFLSKYGLVLDLFGTTGGMGIEPFTYGICFILVDLLFVSIKNLCVYLYQKHKYNKEMKGE